MYLFCVMIHVTINFQEVMVAMDIQLIYSGTQIGRRIGVCRGV